jgi:hypothetical protein
MVAVCGGHNLKFSNIVQLFMFSTQLLPECIANAQHPNWKPRDPGSLGIQLDSQGYQKG